MSNRRLNRNARKTLAVQRSMMRWGELRRLRKGLVRVRRHTLRSGANRLNDESNSRRTPGVSLTHRVSRAALPLLLLALMLTLGRRYTLQHIDVERVVRSQVIPQLETQYHTKIEVGAVDSDWLSRVILRDIVVGRDPNSPLGALARVRRVTVNLDLVGLAIRRVQPLDAVRSVMLDEPQLLVLRDAKGRLNLQDLLGKQKSGGQKWSGRATIANGRVWYEDHAVKSVSGNPVIADAHGLDGWAQANGDGPLQFSAAAQKTYLGAQKIALSGVTARGAVGTTGTWAMADLHLPPIPATLVADYAFPNGDVTAQAGTIGGEVTLTYDKNLPRAKQVMAQGDLVLQNVAVRALKFNEPGTNDPISLTSVNGPLSVSGQTLKTTGVRLTTLGTDWRTSGTLALLPADNTGATTKAEPQVKVIAAPSSVPVVESTEAPKPLAVQPVFDIVLKSASADTMRLLRAARNGPLKKNTVFQQVTLNGGRSQVDVHLIGDAQGARFAGTVGVPQVAVAHPQWGKARSAFARASLVGSGNQSGVQLSGKYQLASLAAQNPKAGDWQSGATGGTIKLAFAKGTPFHLESAFQTSGVVTAMHSGTERAVTHSTARAATLDGQVKLASTPGRLPQVEITRFQARDVRGTFESPQNRSVKARVATVRAATLGGALRLSSPSWDGTFTATNFTGALTRDTASAATLSGSFAGNGLDLAKARARTDIRATGLLARVPGRGGARASNLNLALVWAGNGQLSGGLPGGRAWGRADAQGASGAWEKMGSGRATSAKILGRWANLPDAQPAAADLTLSGFAGTTPRYGAVRGQNLRLVANTPDAPDKWNGEVISKAIDVSGIKLAALAPKASPQVAEQIREIKNLGTVSAHVRFTGAGPEKLPVVKGNLRLSSITLRDVNLRDVSAQVNFDGQRLRIADALAQSDMGALRGDLQASLGANGAPDLSGLRFSFGTQNLKLDATRLNPYIKAQNIAATGTATGSVRLASRAAAGTKNVYEARFDLQMPAAGVRSLEANTPEGRRPASVANLNIVRLRGNGLVQLTNASNWKFAGEATLSAQKADLDGAAPAVPLTKETLNQLDALGVPLWLHGGVGEALRISLRGSVARQGDDLQPNVAGSVEMQSLTVPMPMEGATPLDISEARAEFVAKPGELVVPRLTAFAFGSEINAHATLGLDSSDNVRGQVLAEKLDAAQIRQWIAPLLKTGGDDWGVRGTTFVKADFSGTRKSVSAKVQTRLYDGAARWKEIDMPVDVARAAFTVQLPDWKTVPVESFSVWSRGARLAANGTVERRETSSGELDATLNLKTTLTDLRAMRLNEIPSMVNLQREASIDGLLSADLNVQGTARAPKVTGRAAVRLAQAFGIRVGQTEGDITVALNEGSPVVSLKNISGTTEGAALTGEVMADMSRKVWSADLNTTGLEPGRVLRAADDILRLKRLTPTVGASQVKFPLRTLPVSGSLQAKVSLTGVLGALDTAAALKKLSGTVQARADNLRWRGLPLGTLDADVAVQNGVLKPKKLELTRDLNPVIPIVAAVNGQPTATTNVQSTISTPQPNPQPGGQAVWRISGTLPAAPDAVGLDAVVSLENERLSFFFNALQETRDALKLRAVENPLLNQTIAAIQKMPPNLDGKVSLQANLSGRWSKPMVEVENLTLRDAKARGPLGIEQSLPVLDAAFGYDGQTFTVRRASLRLAAAKRPGAAGTATSSTGSSDDAEADEDEDTVLRIAEGASFTPGGALSFQGRLINANLSQLAPWVPALQAPDGSTLLRGELQQVSFEAGGTVKEPEINGSITVSDITYGKYSVDLLRIARFDIADGFFKIDQPNLTIRKGAFQSSAVWGRIPWNWEKIGPPEAAPIEVHVPLSRDDLGAIAGTFLPSLVRAEADVFAGNIDVSGTVGAPRIAGEITIREGDFVLAPAILPVDAGLTGVNGKITFSDLNRLIISGPDGTGQLSGRLVPPGSIRAKTTGNPTAAERVAASPPPTTPAQAATEQMTSNNPPKTTTVAEQAAQTAKAASVTKVSTSTKTAKVTKTADGNSKLSGAFTLGGDVRLAIDPATGALEPETFTLPLPSLDRHRYNLRFELQDGAVANDTLAGLRNINLLLYWQTQEKSSPGAPAGTLPTITGQQVRWMLGAAGVPERKKASGGAVYSMGALSLADDFGTNVATLANSRVTLLTGLSDFTGSAVYKQLSAPAALGSLEGAQRSRVVLKAFHLGLKNAVSGQLDGVLSLDNRPARPRILPTAPLPSVAARASSARAALGNRGNEEFAGRARLREVQGDVQENKPLPERDEAETAPSPGISTGTGQIEALAPGGDGPVRVSGEVTLSQASLLGAPVGGVSTGGTLPAIPVMDLTLVIGDKVQFSAPNVRADVSGEIAVSGTPADPLVSGTVNMPSGQIRFPTAQARILKGELRITAYRDKETTLLRTLVDINATARGQVRQYTITLDVVGPLDFGSETTQNLRIDVTSNPPLSQDQAFALLLGTRAESGSQERYKDALIGMVSSPLLSGIEQSLQRILGLDALALEYRFNEPLTVQIGKSFGDRIYVSYRRVLGTNTGGAVVSGNGQRYTLRMEYRLKNDLQIGLQQSDISRRITLERTWRF